MKSIMLSLAIALSSGTVCLAQSDKPQAGDSARIEMERKTISAEITQLSDSIKISIYTFDSHIKKPQPFEEGNKLIAGRKELAAFHDQLALYLKEISTTAKNGWNDHAVVRIRLATAASRREYKRILTLL